MSTKNMILGLILAWFFVILLGLMPIDNTNARADGYYPPRIQQLCWDNYYWIDWELSKKYEKRCRVLWNAWTGEEKSNYPF